MSNNTIKKFAFVDIILWLVLISALVSSMMFEKAQQDTVCAGLTTEDIVQLRIKKAAGIQHKEEIWKQ